MALTWKWTVTGEALHVSTAAGTLALSFGGHTNLSFDGEGRLVGAWYAGQTYRRALDNRVLLKWSAKEQRTERRRRFLTEDEARKIIERAYVDARRANDGLTRGDLQLANDPQSLRGEEKARAEAEVHAIQTWLALVSSGGYDILKRDAEHFRHIYRPVSILPPDQYLSVVLQATEGCSYNECSFCTFYRDRRFRIKSVEEFATHLEQARSFLGRGLFVRRTIFLADANAIVIPQVRLLPILDVINQAFSFEQDSTPRSAAEASPNAWTPSAINAFVSAPDALHKNVDDLRELAARHVHTLYVGLESGHDPLRAFLHKPGLAEDVEEAVRSIKQAGLHTGLIFMAGVGGETYREAHFADTVELVRRLPLGQGDLLYVSPFVPAPDSPYLDDMERAGYSSLGEPAVRAEERSFRDALLPWAKARGVRISRYDIREFVY